MYEIWENVIEFIKKFSIEIVIGLIGGFGSIYSIGMSQIELTKKQKILRFLSGAFTAITFTAIIYQAVIYATGVELNGLSMAFLGYANGFLGIEGVTRFLIHKFKGKEKDEK